MRHDLFNNIQVLPAIHPAAAVTDNTAFESEIIDCKDCRAVVFAISHGTNADSDATYTVLVEEGDDAALSDNTAVADAQLLGTEALAGFTAANNDNSAIKIGVVPYKRYVRLTVTPASNTGNAFVSAVAILVGLRQDDADQVKP